MKLSIICCVKESGDSRNVYDSMEHTVGPTWDIEMVEVVGAKSMGSGYNEGTKRATSDILMFTHSDVTSWANKLCWDAVVSKVLDFNTGFVGVAGTVMMPKSGAWWNKLADEDELRGSVAHVSEDKSMMHQSTYGRYGRAAVMDGVMLITTKRVLENTGSWWDNETFHFYDVEMTARANQMGFKNYVMPFPILRGSKGKIDSAWIEARSKFLNLPNLKWPIWLQD